MKELSKLGLMVTLSIFCFANVLLGQGGMGNSEYTFNLQEMENGHTNISWEGASCDGEGHLGYIFSLYDSLGDLKDRLQVIEPSVSVVLGENYNWEVEDVNTSSILVVADDLADITVTEDEHDFPIKDALTWYQGEAKIESSEIEDAIYDEMELEVDFLFDEAQFYYKNDYSIFSLHSLNNNWETESVTMNTSHHLSIVNSFKWVNQVADTLLVEVDYQVRYSADGVEEQTSNTATVTLMYVNDYTGKNGGEIGSATTSLEVYPTVFSDQLNWVYTLSENDALSLDIFDANGRKVYTYQAKDIVRGVYQQNLPTANWRAGNYYCVISSNGKIEKRQLMKLP